MPIVINEIEVSVEVVNSNTSGSSGSSAISPAVKEEIIRECVEQIMEILKQKNER